MATDPVREEAERLVAAAIAAVSMAARGLGGGLGGGSGGHGGFATGSAECCVCPVCRLIATMRDPSVDLAERLATGAGDLATGVASMLRTLARAGGRAGAEDAGAEEAGEEAAGASGWASDEVDDPWHAATVAPAADSAGEPATGAARAPMAKKAVAKKAVVTKAAKKAVAKKAVAKKAVPEHPPKAAPAE